MTTVKFLRFFQILLNGIWAIPTILVLSILQCFVPIKFKSIYSENIGHFIFDGAEEIYNYKTKKNREKIFFYFSNPHTVANKFWAQILKRQLPISNFFGQYIGKWTKIIFRDKFLHASGSSVITRKNSRFLKDVYQFDSLGIKFELDENNLGKNWLRSYGWREGEPYLCLLVRDSSFDVYNNKFKKYETLNYRNSSIEKFESSVSWLCGENIWVIRMGRISKKPMRINHSKFIDYSFCNDQSDFLDIWLFSNSSGIISTSSGPDALACIFDVPLLLVDFLPLMGMFSFTRGVTVPKRLVHQESNKYLNLNSTLDISFTERHLPNYFLNADDYDFILKKVEVNELNEEDILEAVKEFWSRIKGNWNMNESDSNLQNKFWYLFKNHKYFSINHNYINPEAAIGSDWLRKMGPEFLT